MKKLFYIIISCLLTGACSAERDNTADKAVDPGIQIKLARSGFSTRVIDEDNLESEQVINDISVFFTDPSSDEIIYKYVDAGFSTSGDYRIVNIPLDANDLQRKDIYVITNYGDDAALEALNTITDMTGLKTPVISKSNNLEAGKGFCMYGMTADFDFTDESLGSPVVNVERTCAKIRITLSFPGNPRLSPDNSFLIAHAASYTYVMEGNPNELARGDYFNFAAEIDFLPFGTAFRNTAYVYQATEPPVLYLYTHINDSTDAQEFTADLPVPDRNYLYDIDARIYEEISATRSEPADRGYLLETTVTAYDCFGRMVWKEKTVGKP